MKKFKKIFTRVFCILLASLLLVMSPISKYFDTQRIDKVEASASAGAVIGGLGVLYIICHTLGYDIGTIHATSIMSEIEDFVEDCFVNETIEISMSELADIKQLFSTNKFAETIALKTIITKLYEVVSSYLESKEYDETSGVHQLAQDRYTYNHLPRTYDTVSYSEKFNNATASKGFTNIITAYDDNTDCYYSMSFSNVGDNEYIAVLNDGLFYLTFDSSNNLEYIYDCNTDIIFGWKNDGSSYSDYTEDVYDASLSITGSQLADIIRSGYQIYSDRFLGVINTSSSNLVSGTDTISTIQSQRISDYSVPSDLDIIRHGVTDVTFPERIANSGYDLTTSQASAIANAYSEAFSSSTGQAISARYPTTDRTKVEDNIIADVYPVVDRTFSNTNTGESTDTNEGTDTGTNDNTQTLGLWDTLFGWLKKIYEACCVIAEVRLTLNGIVTSNEEYFEYMKSLYPSQGWADFIDEKIEQHNNSLPVIIHNSLDEAFSGDWDNFIVTINEQFLHLGLLPDIKNAIDTTKTSIVGAISNNIQQILPNILEYKLGSRLDTLNDTLEQTVVGALANIGVYDIDIWDTTKDILDNMFTIDTLTNAFGVDKIHTNSDLVISGLGDLSDTITNVREGIDILVGNEIGKYDSDIMNTLLAIDKILTNGIVLDGENDLFPGLVDDVTSKLDDLITAVSELGLGSWLWRYLTGDYDSTDFNFAKWYTESMNLITAIISGIKALPINIAQAIVDVIVEPFETLLTALFVPDLTQVEQTINDLRENFSFADSVILIWEDILEALDNSDNAPTIYLHFENSKDAKFQQLGTMKAIDFEWYEPYKPFCDAIISAVLWAFFLLRLIQGIPDILRGVSVSRVDSSSTDVPFNQGIGVDRPRLETRGFEMK